MFKVRIKETSMDLSMWVISCFDSIRSELPIPRRGSIPLNATSYTRDFGLVNEGVHVFMRCKHKLSHS
jgi:hypothetical protein